MTVRLLPKSEIEKRKVAEAQVSMQEGLKVAERIDTLRETLASEETAFDSYRTTSLRDIQKEIDARFALREELDADLAQKRRERAALMLPLTEEWKELDKMGEMLETKETLLDRKELNLNAIEADLQLREHAALDKEERADNLASLALSMHSKAEIEVENAKEASADIRNHAQVALSSAELIESNAIDRENAVSVREKEVETVRQTNHMVRKANIQEQIRLADMRRTLEGELNRLKK